MQTYKTVLSEKQLAAALIGLDREAKLILRIYGDSPTFRDQFTTRAYELWDTVSPRDRELTSAGIRRILAELGVEASARLEVLQRPPAAPRASARIPRVPTTKRYSQSRTFEAAVLQAETAQPSQRHNRAG
jgi:hypothetical protein